MSDIYIWFYHQYGANPECVFWEYDENYDASTLGWSPVGCRMVRQEDGKYTICHCDHLTSFAAIMVGHQTYNRLLMTNCLHGDIITY